MPQFEPELKIKGLWNSPNPLSEVPKGGLSEAFDIVIDEPSLADTRRGQNFFTSTSPLENVDRFFGYYDSIISHDGTELLLHDGTDSSIPFTVLSTTFTNPDDDYVTHGVEANKNLYMTALLGIQKLDVDLAEVVPAGAPPGLDLTGDLTGASGYLADDSAVAYRMLWGNRDGSNNLILGAPTTRFVITNTTGGTRDVDLTFSIPNEITTSDFYQLYRTVRFTPSTVQPNDEMYLVLEGSPSAPEIAAGVMTVTDSTPDSLLGATLYTSPSQEGAQNANYPPPYAKDITYFQNMTFYANTKGLQHTNFNLIAVGTPNIDVGDTVTFTIGATTIILTGAVAEDATADEFEIFTGGTVAENIADTALSFCRVVNQSASNTYFYAYYLSGFDDLPGQILIQNRNGVMDPFTVTSTTPASFSPTFPLDSTQDVNQNRVYVSKQLQPESVPLYSYLDVGSANAPILRILALRDYVFVHKTDGIFTINGTSFASLQQQLLDNSTKLIAPESLVVFNNQLLGFVDQGVAAISAAGVEIISRPIEKTLLQLSQLGNFRANTFGVAYESDRKYMLWTIQDENDTYPTIAYIYNQATNTWTNWLLDRTAGFVNPQDNMLYMFNPANKAFYRERKTFTNFDYMDESYAFTAISENTALTFYTLLVADAQATHIEIGDVIFQDDLYSYVSDKVQNTMTGDWTLTLTINIEFDVGASLNVGKGFTSRLKFLPLDMDQPGTVQHNQEFTLFFKNANFDSIAIGFTTDFYPDETQYDLIPPQGLVSGDWGFFDWGEVNWGGVGVGLGEFPIRSNFPRNYSKSHWIQPTLELSQPLTNMSFTGMNLVGRLVSTKYPGARMAA